MSERSELSGRAHVVALAALPEVGPARLAHLLERGPAAEVFAALAAGALVPDEGLAQACARSDPRALLRRWQLAASELDVAALWSAHEAAGVAVDLAGEAAWPARLAGDHEPPAVLFRRGDAGLLAAGQPAVAVVGTRRCTRYGWDVAHQLGRELASAGVAVVSGLARGIDLAAHRGALDAVAALDDAAGVGRPIGVAGTGLDVVYPPEARPIWSSVADHGVLLSEAPLGTRPSRWRFPARNRLLAALADAVVVVESGASGGALLTVDEAAERDRPVLAVPGPITSPASAGTNQLLADVALPVCGTADVLAAIGLPPTGRRRDVLDLPATVPPPGDPLDRRVLDAVGFTPATLDAVAARARLGLGEAAAALVRLEASGHLVAAGGTWSPRLARADGDRTVTK